MSDKILQLQPVAYSKVAVCMTMQRAMSRAARSATAAQSVSDGKSYRVDASELSEEWHCNGDDQLRPEAALKQRFPRVSDKLGL